MGFGRRHAIVLLLAAVSLTWAASDLDMKKPTIMPGSPIKAKTDDPEVQKAATFAIYEFNNRTNDMFLFKISGIRKAMIQVVKGMKFMLETKIGRTMCRKREPYNLDNCDFQKDKRLQQAFSCYFEVWVVPWLNIVKVPVVLCE
ncbi:cystatin-F [Ambystoma mexicanum]|uniref:cystatin-F n=1 Tax=Ambystoma mexicanum TaxID=8296 RepID=UPI0037E71E55